MANFSIRQVDPLELERRAYDSLFDLMEAYRAGHPEASDDECYEHVCFRNAIHQPADYAKETRRDSHA